MTTRAATVRSAGPDGVAVVHDDGTAQQVAADVVDPRLLRLHPGQRVTLHLAGPGSSVHALTLAGMTPPVATPNRTQERTLGP